MSVLSSFSSNQFAGRVVALDQATIEVSGRFLGSVALPAQLRYQAASPAEKRLSVAGSGLPFANESMAYIDGVNSGLISLGGGGSFSFRLTRPNSFYCCQGKHLGDPHVLLTVIGSDGQSAPSERVLVGVRTPDRSLSSLPGRPIRSTGR